MTILTMTIDDLINNDLSNVYSDNLLDGSFAQIDWQAPWLSHLKQLNYLSATIKQLSDDERYEQVASSDIDSEFAKDARHIAAVLNQALKQQSEANNSSLPTTKPTTDNKAQALKFVSQDALPEGMGYEQFIGTTGQIPTRDNLHDLFNGSIWLSFPKTKALLNYYHMLEIAADSDSDKESKSQRGRVRDTITVFDENGAVLVTSKPSVGEALMDFDWQNSLVKPRESWDNPKMPNENAKAAVYIFGHALLEQLIEPRKPLCAHSVVITVSQDFFALSTAERINYLDDKLAEYMDKLLSEQNVTPRKLAPLPILGVPHFWPENINPEFYEDKFVFRSGRHRQRTR